MNPGSQNFESLRRMLALKRHEQPPPGYFDRFSNTVIARLQAGDQGRKESLLERLFEQAPWLQRLWDGLEAKPVFAGAFGVAVCALLISGLVYSENVEVGPVRALRMANDMRTSFVQPALASEEIPLVENRGGFSTNPVPMVGSSIFEEAQQSLFPIDPQRVNYEIPGN